MSGKENLDYRARIKEKEDNDDVISNCSTASEFQSKKADAEIKKLSDERHHLIQAYEV